MTTGFPSPPGNPDNGLGPPSALTEPPIDAKLATTNPNDRANAEILCFCILLF